MTLTEDKEFRIWDKDKKDWYLEEVGLSSSDESEFVWKHNNLILCQFTGVYDICGQKIFEFDIVKSETKYGGERIFYVKYLPNQCRFNMSDDLVKSRRIEVIGNVFKDILKLDEPYRQKIKEWLK